MILQQQTANYPSRAYPRDASATAPASMQVVSENSIVDYKLISYATTQLSYFS